MKPYDYKVKVMGNIKLLDENTINKIAAGEVIDRPASIVKELMENSIDAGASAITVEIKDGGTSFIRITDNGCGIMNGDIKSAFLRHSTSKIKSVKDLLTVSSLGFRGEALASIAAVCQVEMITKSSDELTGTRYIINGGKEISIEEIGAPVGTTIIVRNIFYNTPARRKFLKSNAAEAGYIADIVEKIAIANADISIQFINNNKVAAHTAGNANLKDIIYNIYGRDITYNLVEVHGKNDFMKISGYIGKPVISKGNRNFENYFVNGRYVKNTIITNAIEEAYKPYMMQHKHPFVALNFTIAPEFLDVNVHPAKMELRLKNSEEVYPFILNTISDGLMHREFIPDISEVETENNTLKSKQDAPHMPEPFEIMRAQKLSDSYTISVNNTSTDNDTFSDNKTILDNKTSSYSDTVHEEYSYASGDKREAASDINDTKHSDIIDDIKISREKQLDLFDTKVLTKEARPKHKLIGQVFDTYWIIEYGDKMFIIDQHAAHEKVLFEQIMERIKTEPPTSQNLNPPIILTLSMSEEELLKKYMPNFNEIGFEIEHFGGKEYAVRAVPYQLVSIGDKELLMDIIDNLKYETNTIGSNLITEKIASCSCKAAVKGNNRLSFEEANALIDQLLSLDNPYHCPHGRPTIISMSKYELEKKFKRII